MLDPSKLPGMAPGNNRKKLSRTLANFKTFLKRITPDLEAPDHGYIPQLHFTHNA